MALSAENQASILTGVASADSIFYALGGAILVVLAGMWGFYKVMGLITGRDEQPSDTGELAWLQEEEGWEPGTLTPAEDYERQEALREFYDEIHERWG